MNSPGFTFHVTLLAGLFMGVVPAMSWGGDEALKLRMLTEGPTAWKAMEEHYEQLEGEFVLQTTHVPATNRDREARVGFKLNGSLIRVDVSEPGNERGRAINNRYSLDVHRTNRGNPYLISYYGKGAPVFELKVRNELIYYIQAPFGMQTKTLAQWLAEPGFMVKAVDWKDQSQKRHVQVKCQYELPAGSLPDPNAIPIERVPYASFTAKIVLDPSAHWCVQEYEMVSANSTLSGTVSYNPGNSVVPMVRQATRTISSKHGQRLDVASVQKLVHKTVPEREFTLAAYGLPELEEGFAQEASYLWLYLISIGLMVVLSAIIMAWQQWRKRKAAAG